MTAKEIRSAWLTLNRQCNLRCKWCYSQGSGFKDELAMPLELAKSLVDICLSIGVKSFILIGGEPTIYKDFFALVEYILDHGGRITVMTNGVLLGEDAFCMRIAKLNCKNCQFNISLKGINDNEYFDNCGSAAFSSVVKGVRNCEKFGIKCSFIYVISSDNVSNLIEFAEGYKRNGFGKYPLNFSHCNDVLENKTNSFHSANKTKMSSIEIDREFNRQYEKLCEILGDIFGLHQTLPLCMVDKKYFDLMRERNQVFTACHVLRKTGVIFDIDGGLLLCNHLVGYALGKYGCEYSDSASFIEYFESPLVRGMRQKLTTMPSRACNGCGNASICGGGCCLRWFTETFEGVKSEVRTGKEVK